MYGVHCLAAGHPLFDAAADGAIDPTYWREGNTSYLIYKEDGNSRNLPTPIIAVVIDDNATVAKRTCECVLASVRLR